MLKVLVSSITPRISYTVDLVFGEILGLSAELVERLEEVPADTPIIDYRIETDTPLSCRIPNEGLLHETSIRQKWADVEEGETPILFPSSNTELGFDVLTTIFYLVTDYEKWVESHMDQHDRYDPHAYSSGKGNWFAEPLCELYAEKLWQYLKKHFPQLERSKKESRVIWTFDLDNPWKYKHKPFYVQWGGLLTDLLSGKWQQAGERVNALLGGRDPHDFYGLLADYFPKEKTHLFILLERKSKHDSRFTWRNPKLRELVISLKEAGYRLGIHPSYTTFLDEEQISFEKEKLEEWVNDIDSGRQHYLKVRYPETYQFYLQAGIVKDFSACLYHMTGFPMGMTRGFDWFDLGKNEKTPLRLQPTQIMDVSLKGYMGLSVEESIQEMDRIFSRVNEYSGDLCVLLHNEALSDSGEWKGWKEPILNWVQKVNQL
ncbi:MAG: hypothetical protein AAFR66_12580 [Bacteroidota bacterium]